MDEKNKAVETKTETAAAQQVVETKEQTATTVQAEDLLAVIADYDAKLAKVEADKENYRKGMLLAKGKPVDGEAEESVEDKVARLVKEQLLSTESAKLQAEKDVLIKSVLKRNQELELALKNRGGVSNTGITAGVDTTKASNPSVFSDEQISALKARGWDDKKIEKLVETTKKLKGRVL